MAARIGVFAVEGLVVEVARARVEHARAHDLERALDEVRLFAVEKIDRRQLAGTNRSERISVSHARNLTFFWVPSRP